MNSFEPQLLPEAHTITALSNLIHACLSTLLSRLSLRRRVCNDRHSALASSFLQELCPNNLSRALETTLPPHGPRIFRTCSPKNAWRNPLRPILSPVKCASYSASRSQFASGWPPAPAHSNSKISGRAKANMKGGTQTSNHKPEMCM